MSHKSFLIVDRAWKRVELHFELYYTFFANELNLSEFCNVYAVHRQYTELLQKSRAYSVMLNVTIERALNSKRR